MASAPLLTAAALREASASLRDMATSRISLRQSISGALICFPGVSDKNRNWSVPSRLQVETLLGAMVFVVSDDGTVDPKGAQHRVAGVLDRGGRMAHKNLQLGECTSASGSDVFVIFGEHGVEYVGPDCGPEPACADVDDVSAPRTPDPFER